jgi:hypothetical protein
MTNTSPNLTYRKVAKKLNPFVPAIDLLTEEMAPLR